MFETTYEPVSITHPEWGQLAVLPWDAEIFGFPVADYRAGDAQSVASDIAQAQSSFVEWAAKREVELIACSIAADDRQWLALLGTFGFSFVEYTLDITQPRVQKTDLPENRLPVRLADPRDREAIVRVAEGAFRFGRYHADPRFPTELADLRYGQWVRNALSPDDPTSRVYVIGEPGAANGFFQVRLKEDNLAQIGIIAVDRQVQRSMVGMELCAGTMNELKRIGVKKVTSKISAGNMDILNLAFYFGYRISHPQCVFHWHSPKAQHLVPLESFFTQK